MRTRKRFPLILAIAILLLHAGCGDAPRESAATVEPPIEALRGVPIFPLSLEVTQTGTADALEASFTVLAPPDSVASWYRTQLLDGVWRLVGDVRAPDGTITLHAQRDGPPLWVIIQRSTAGQGGTVYRLIGAVRDSTEGEQ